MEPAHPRKPPAAHRSPRDETPVESLAFDADFFRARMAAYLGEENDWNHPFYEALRYALGLHEGQTRRSGAPYISHPCAVAEILLTELRLTDPGLLAAALLHDLVEDVPSVTLEDIEARFGPRVAEIVDGCTKLTRFHYERSALSDLTRSKIFITASRRLGVLVIKLCDRLHNIRTLHFLPQNKRQRIAQETVEVYAPIAAKLNIFPIKRELYHLALCYLYPRKSRRILNLTRGLLDAPETLAVKAGVVEALESAGCEASVRARLRGLGSYYDPVKRTLDIANVENQADVAVIVASGDPIECYRALGAVNLAYPPIPRSVRDFIANPKQNGYQSLHARMRMGGRSYLVKVRTAAMDAYATFGILTGWKADTPLSDEHWGDVSELLRTIGEYGGAGAQRKELIRLSEAKEIFVSSPKGDVYPFPRGSIVLDFAYRIHSEIGDHCRGAFVNGERRPMTHPLDDGDTVQVLTSAYPLELSMDLEELCKTPKARSAVYRHIAERRELSAAAIGRGILAQEIVRHGLPEDILTQDHVPFALEILNVRDMEDLYLRLGQDELSPHAFLYYFQSPETREAWNPKQVERLDIPRDRNVLRVASLDRVVHKFARCCRALPCGEGVVATLSERGVTFHRGGCSDLTGRHDLPAHRLLDVQWDEAARWPVPLEFLLRVEEERPGEIFKALARVPGRFTVRRIETVPGPYQGQVRRVAVEFRDFAEAKLFLACFAPGSAAVEWYGRAEK